eukprot:c1737_g1_i1.p1 GENE.c1737_g1_i1~~c1737_g1_i1.p1  ORF type:complete len:248 (+),score=124.85 c1737_g1_i1:51-746(+)
MSVSEFRKPKLIAFAGSTRTGSVNTKLVKCVGEFAQAHGAEVEVIDLKNFTLPLYDGDLEASAGLPKEAIQLKEKFESVDGFLIASPEYNGQVTPLLINMFAWTSRPHRPNEQMYHSFKGKSAAVLSASPGGLGGMRGLRILRDLLLNLGVNVLTEQATIGGAFNAFDKDGKLADPKQIESVTRVAVALVEHTRMSANSVAMCSLVKQLKEAKVPAEYGEVSIANVTIPQK